MTIVRYPGVWRVLHWLIAALVLILLILGFVMVARSQADLWDELTNTLYAWHKSIGFAVLMLMIVRVGLRLFCKTPPLSMLPLWQQWLAHTAHAVLYALLLIIPLLGWAGISAYPALQITDQVALPSLPGIAPDEAFAKEFFAIHSTLAYVLLALLILHIAAALKHRWIDRDGIYERMRLIQKSDQKHNNT